MPEELKAMNVLYDHSLNMYRSETLHISLFRATGVFEDQGFLEAMA